MSKSPKSGNHPLPYGVGRDELNDEEIGLLGAPDTIVPTQPAVPSLWGMPLKYVSLVTLAIQNSMLTIIMHYSRVSTPPSRTYSAATAVLMNEVLKGTISLVIAFTRIDPPSNNSALSPISGLGAYIFRARRLWREIFSSDCWKLSIPAILYVIQNNLQYVAASNLEAATFQVSYQMKILTTAGFSVLLLRKKLTSSQWVALLSLAIGVGVVQIQAGAAKHAGGVATAESGSDVHTMHPLKGFMAVAAACFTSGLAGVYFEMVLKNSQADLWVRNVQLSLFSLLPAIAPVLFNHASGSTPVVEGGWLDVLFHNFGAWAWATVMVQVFGGLITALVIKYADNILKGFATSLSIVISFLASVALFDFHITLSFICGSIIVLIATWLYNSPKRISFLSGKDGWGLGWREKMFNGSPVSISISPPPRSPPPSSNIYPLTRMSSTSSVSSLASLPSSLSSHSTPTLYEQGLEGKDGIYTR
ncbi:nucleotide-sugar transporter [Pluteus cervinus]|uniref:Nucleotide-sugar transporter n=1 Tax=Pluteus cervinus TaxID=181527 RepID=A0ACD3BDN7_9AGAR|nr:nucleotide-sugar transporter [Pluteus cervinus]